MAIFSMMLVRYYACAADIIPTQVPPVSGCPLKRTQDEMAVIR
jgi:hypothetical protein